MASPRRRKASSVGLPVAGPALALPLFSLPRLLLPLTVEAAPLPPCGGGGAGGGARRVRQARRQGARQVGQRAGMCAAQLAAGAQRQAGQALGFLPQSIYE